jgi:hypothetical protein
MAKNSASIKTELTPSMSNDVLTNDQQSDFTSFPLGNPRTLTTGNVTYTFENPKRESKPQKFLKENSRLHTIPPIPAKTIKLFIISRYYTSIIFFFGSNKMTNKKNQLW